MKRKKKSIFKKIRNNGMVRILAYLQEGRFSATVGSKKHPELSRRNPKRAVPKNRHIISLPRSDGEIQIPTLDGQILSSAGPEITESSIPIIREPQRQKAKGNRKLSVRRIAQLTKKICPCGPRGRVRARRRQKRS